MNFKNFTNLIYITLLLYVLLFKGRINIRITFQFYILCTIKDFQ